jgi:hypothetical protein
MRREREVKPAKRSKPERNRDENTSALERVRLVSRLPVGSTKVAMW